MGYEANRNGWEAMCDRLIVKVNDRMVGKSRKYSLIFLIPPFTIVGNDKGNLLVGKEGVNSDKERDKTITEIMT